MIHELAAGQYGQQIQGKPHCEIGPCFICLQEIKEALPGFSILCHSKSRTKQIQRLDLLLLLILCRRGKLRTRRLLSTESDHWTIKISTVYSDWQEFLTISGRGLFPSLTNSPSFTLRSQGLNQEPFLIKPLLSNAAPMFSH